MKLKYGLTLLAVWIFTVITFYPGGMSVDSVSILTQARAFYFSDHQPPAFGMLWHFVDLVIPGPQGMLLLLTAGFYASLLLVFINSRATRSWTEIFLFLAIALFPPIFGIIGVIWIDIGMATALLSAVALALAAKKSATRQKRIVFSLLSFLILTLASVLRHNALPAAVGLLPLILSTLVPMHNLRAMTRGVCAIIIASVVLLGSGILVKTVMTSSHAQLWQCVAIYDLAGISVRLGKNLVPQESYPSITLEDLKTLYTSRSYTPLMLGVQIHSELVPQPTARAIPFVSDGQVLASLKRAWIRNILAHPWYYLKHRARVFAELTNIKSRQLWTPVYDGIAANALGISPKPLDVNNGYLKALNALALSTDLFRPFVYIILSVLVAGLTLILNPVSKWIILSLTLSMLLHSCGLFIGVASGDFRYSHWIIICALLSSGLLVRDVFLPRTQEQPYPSLFARAWSLRALIFRLTKREIEARYRGSLLGVIWPFLTPLVMLAVYTFVFSVVFASRWGAIESRGAFALLMFSGLLIVTVYTECVARAPSLMLENPAYIKKVIFPLEILPWVTVLAAMFNACISFVVLMFFYLFVFGTPPWTALLLPLVMVPLVLTSLGTVYLFSSIGVFVRDLKQIVAVLITIVMFLSPIFYPISAVPEKFRVLLYLNPLTLILESSKQLLFWNTLPSFTFYLLSTLGSLLIAYTGYWWFMRVRKGFADVV